MTMSATIGSKGIFRSYEEQTATSASNWPTGGALAIGPRRIFSNDQLKVLQQRRKMGLIDAETED